MGTKSIIKLSVALYNNTVHSSTKFTPNEVLFNQSNVKDPEEVLKNAQEIFLKTKLNIEKTQNKIVKLNEGKEDPPFIEPDRKVFVIPNIRTKTQPRANPTVASNIKEKTFVNSNNIKRHKSKIKRLKKLHNL